MFDRLWRRARPHLAGECGPVVARTYHRLLAIGFFIAFASLGVQVSRLIGGRGLLPIDETARHWRESGASFFDHPSLFFWGASDGLLVAGCALGSALALAGLLGFWPRVMWAILVPLYLSYAVAGREFLAFQWDNLLLESGLLAIFLPRNARATWIHLLLRVLLIKLYFESGLAKWQSPIGDWQDGSAMRFYYETAPLPGPLASWFHRLPAWWHWLEGWAVLALELLVPWLSFAPRRVRTGVAVALTVFQLFNLVSANYGFFVPLALALHVMLLDDTQLRAIEDAVGRRVGNAGRRILALLTRAPEPEQVIRAPRARHGIAVGVTVVYLGVSMSLAWNRFGPMPLQILDALAAPLHGLRLINVYHLFGQITRERIEPEVQVQQTDRSEWQAAHLRYKPGDVQRGGVLVQPHQPRLDFQLWFHGLNHRRMTTYLAQLLMRLCTTPSSVEAFFLEPLPPEIHAVRVVYWRYRFAPAGADAAWQRTMVHRTPVAECAPLRE